MTSVLVQIASGDLDADLENIIKSAQDRLTALRRSRSSTEFSIGDKVIFNDYCGTKYIRGHKATIVGKKQKKLVVVLDTPMGRFSRQTATGEWISSEIVVPPSIIDLV